MMKFTVDRIEDGIAVLEKEDVTHIEISSDILPEGAKEGSVLIFDGAHYNLDLNAEEEARDRIIKKQRSIFKKREK